VLSERTGCWRLATSERTRFIFARLAIACNQQDAHNIHHLDRYAGNPYTITTNTFNNAIAALRCRVSMVSRLPTLRQRCLFAYHSLQTTVSRRWSRGYFQAAYTWSKSTDATSTGNTAFNTAFNDESNLNGSRGLSDFDRTHRLAVTIATTCPSSHPRTALRKRPRRLGH